MKFPIITLLTVFFVDPAISDAKCGGCNAYNCMERDAHCGQDGYLIGFGEKNCRNFKQREIYETFDGNGQKFINCTADCLVDHMGHYVQRTIDCAELKSSGFQSHPTCYLQCGFCQVCKTNKWALLMAYDFRDFASIEAIKQVAIVIRKCGIFNCFLS